MTTEEINLRSKVFQLAWPAVIRMGFNMLVNIIDMIMIGSLGASVVGAVGIANQLFFFCIAAITAFTAGTTALVAQHWGAGDKKSAGEVARQSLAMALIVTGILSVLGYLFSRNAIALVLSTMEEIDLSVLAAGSSYLRIISISIMFRFGLIVVNSAYQGSGDMKTPLYILTMMNLINIIGNALLIYGLGPFPRLGADGAAIATAFAGIVAGIYAFSLLVSRRSPFPASGKRFRFQLPVIKKILSIGAPSAIEQFIVHGGNVLYTSLAASLGTVAIAANQVLINTFSITATTGIGFAITATTLVGQFLGAGKRDLALKGGMETTRFAWILTGVAGALFLAFPTLILGLFVDDPLVIDAAKGSLYLLAVMQPALSIVLSLSGGLRGAGDTRWVMYITFFTTLVFRLLITLAFLSMGLGLLGIWLGMAVETILRSLLIYRRFHTVIWKVKSLVEHHHPAV